MMGMESVNIYRSFSSLWLLIHFQLRQRYCTHVVRITIFFNNFLSFFFFQMKSFLIKKKNVHNLNLKHQLCLLCCFNIFHACLCYHLLSTISNYNLFYFYGAGSHCQGRLIIDFVECKSMNPVFPNGCYLMFKMKS